MSNPRYHREPIVVTQAMWEFVIGRLIELEKLAGIEPRTFDGLTGELSPVTATPGAVAVKVKRGTRIAKGWMPDPDVVADMQAKFPHITNSEWVDTHASFLDYWVSQPGARGVKLDWNATWRNWVRREFAAAHYRSRAKMSAPVQSTVDQKVADLQSMKEPT